jgi:site-specific recombinase XerD
VTGLQRQHVTLGTGAHIEVLGKGRKQRAVPLCKPVAAVLEAWLDELSPSQDDIVFPSTRGGRLSADAAARLLKKYVAAASDACPSLKQKNITFHCLRHTTAMDLLHTGVEQTVIALWLGHESIETTQIAVFRYSVAAHVIAAISQRSAERPSPSRSILRRHPR